MPAACCSRAHFLQQVVVDILSIRMVKKRVALRAVALRYLSDFPLYPTFIPKEYIMDAKEYIMDVCSSHDRR